MASQPQQVAIKQLQLLSRPVSEDKMIAIAKGSSGKARLRHKDVKSSIR